MKKSKIIQLFILLICSINAYAQRDNPLYVEQAVAETVASGAFKYHYENTADVIISKTETYKVDGEDLFYIISFEKNGFAIVPIDYRITPILAISNEEAFDIESLDTESDSLKEGLELWIDVIVEQIKMTQRFEPPTMYANTVGLWIKYFQKGKQFREFSSQYGCNPGNKDFPICNGGVVIEKKNYEGPEPPEPPGPYIDPCPDKIVVTNIGPLLQCHFYLNIVIKIYFVVGEK
jgi:hypothetical protein